MSKEYPTVEKTVADAEEQYPTAAGKPMTPQQTVVMFALLTWQGIRICKATPDSFGFFISLGITVSLALQAAINIAVVTGSIPTKGLPLPFISTGGSSILLSMLGVGILLNIAKQSGGADVSASNVENNRSIVI